MFYEIRESVRIIIDMNEKPLVLLTGATGFIGRHVTRELLKRGYKLRILTRHPELVNFVDKQYVEIKKVNYLDIQTLYDVAKDVDFVVHIAGVIKGRTFDVFKKGNIYSTRNLLEAVRRGNVRKFVFLSSQSAAGPSYERPLTEEDEAKPVSFYGLSKKIAERYVEKSGIPYVILRPSAVFGEGDRETFLLFKMVKNGISISIGDGPLFNIIYVGDLVEIIVRVLERNVINKKYFVNNGEVLSPKRLNEIIKKIMGKRYVFHIKVPQAAAVFFAFLAEYYSNITGRESMLTREKMRELRQYRWLASNELLKKEIFDRFTSSEEALKRAYVWYKKEGWL